jgi:hypothetical protein
MNTLYNYSLDLITALKQLTQQTFTNVSACDIDCTDLPLHENTPNCIYENSLEGFFKIFENINCPCLYWFEITSSHSAKELHDLIPGLNSKIDRNVPSYRKGFSNWDSRILYVGKVKTKISDRMVLHLGYGRNKRTQGLQLSHWAKDIGLKLRLNYIILPDSLKELASSLELHLAKELHPIYGKHK